MTFDILSIKVAIGKACEYKLNKLELSSANLGSLLVKLSYLCWIIKVTIVMLSTLNQLVTIRLVRTG